MIVEDDDDDDEDRVLIKERELQLRGREKGEGVGERTRLLDGEGKAGVRRGGWWGRRKELLRRGW